MYIIVILSDLTGIQISSVLGLPASFFQKVFCLHVFFDCVDEMFFIITLQMQVTTELYADFIFPSIFHK